MKKPTLFNFLESALGVGVGMWLVLANFQPVVGWILLTLGVIGFVMKWRALRSD